MNASQLVKEKAELLARIAEIDRALALLGNPAAPVQITTRRNLRNTWLSEGVQVYANEALTVPADKYDHGGYVTAEDAARLENEGMIDGDLVSL